MPAKPAPITPISEGVPGPGPQVSSVESVLLASSISSALREIIGIQMVELIIIIFDAMRFK